MDNLGNTESSYFRVDEPVDQKKERIEEKSKAQAGLHLLEDIIERFNKRIAFYNTLDSVDVETDPEVHLRMVIANKQTIQNLIEERDYLEGLKSTITR